MGESSSFAQVCIPKFDGDYDHWSMLMENLLRSKEYWRVVTAGVQEPAEGTELTAEQTKVLDDSRLRDLKAKNYLFNSIDKTILKTITSKATAKELWDSMKMKFQGNARVQKAQLQSLRRSFEILEMKEGEAVTDYFGRVMVVANAMRNCGESMPDEKIVEKILRTLTERFNYVVCSIEESKDISLLSVDALQSSLLVHEQKFHKKPAVEEDQVLKVTYESGSRGGRGQGRGYFGRGRGRGGRGWSRDTVECYKCHRLGHYRSECPEWNNQHQQAHFSASVDMKDDVLLMAWMDEDEMVFHEEEKESEVAIIPKIFQSKEPEEPDYAMALLEPAADESRYDSWWFLDSGCSNHMTGNKEWFISIETTGTGLVKLGNGTKLEVKGRGPIRVKTDLQALVIQDTYYVPGLKTNLLSLGQLQQKGLEFLIKGNVCRVYHETKGLIMNVHMKTNRMFVVHSELPGKQMESELQCLQITAADTATLTLWHRRYGHISFQGLIGLQKKNMVTGLPVLKGTPGVCATCLAGKQHRKPFPKKSQWRASRKLELLHADLCGPITPISNGGKRYVFTIIDDFSKKLWVFFLAQKSETLGVFKNFKAQVEKEVGAGICCLRTDRGGEFILGEFQTLCEEAGIRRQLTAALTPQQNGVAERKNRAIMNMVRCLLSDTKVPAVFWPEAVLWTTHVLNRSPTVAHEHKTPQEVWTGQPPSVDHFKVFGCIGHVHIPDKQRRKLDDKSQPCIFLGLSSESKAYKLYNPLTKKLIVSRDVVFDESQGWSWDKEAQPVDTSLVWEGDDEDWYASDDEEADEKSDDAVVTSSQSTTTATLTSPTLETNEEEESVEDSSHNTDSGSTSTGLGSRVRKPPAHLQDYDLNYAADWCAMVAVTEDPLTYEEASKDEKWNKAMQVEMTSIKKNDTWELTVLPEGARCIGLKWVYKTKLKEDGLLDKHKARVVAKGFSQQHGIDFTEVFAPVARWDTIRTFLALAAAHGWPVFQLDVKSAFLNGTLTEEVYVEQPKGFVIAGEEHKVYRLKKALYGLKQAPRAWYSRIEGYFVAHGFQKCPYEHTLFVKKIGKSILLVSLYVDDLMFAGNDPQLIAAFKQSMEAEFEMTDLGRMKYFLGVEVSQCKSGIFISQQKYTREVLERFKLLECNHVKNPMTPGLKFTKAGDGILVNSTEYKQLIGSLLYITATRPDIMYSVCLLSRFMENPTRQHMLAAKRVLRYLKGTLGYGVLYIREAGEESLQGFTDSDYAGDVDDRKSTSGYVFFLAGGAVSWASKKQPVVTLSTTEAEFVAASFCATQCVWLRRVLCQMGWGESVKDSTTIYCDNNSTIKLSKNPVFHGRSKHIDVRFHFLRDLANEGVVELEYIGTGEQVADVMTKPLKLEMFQLMRERLGVCNGDEVE
ncbi:unnamed protein product [Linum trigynum]|uniref:Polyprotein n=1 Tax=Linum trigynum TaxID=586398 RepID=A0AAV2GFX6_9ROSI